MALPGLLVLQGPPAPQVQTELREVQGLTELAQLTVPPGRLGRLEFQGPQAQTELRGGLGLTEQTVLLGRLERLAATGLLGLQGLPGQTPQ